MVRNVDDGINKVYDMTSWDWNGLMVHSIVQEDQYTQVLTNTPVRDARQRGTQRSYDPVFPNA
jgi:hypothetical protein